MSFPIRKMIVPQSKWNIKATYSMVPEFVTVHNTYNDAPAVNEAAYMTRNNMYTSFHYAVDHKEAIQLIPLNRSAWHAGDGNGKGNRASIGVEICYSKSGGSRFTQAEKNGAELVARILKTKGWGINKVKKHQDWSGKYCPHRTLDLGWQRFLKMVEKELKALNSADVKPHPTKQTPFLVVVTSKKLNRRKSPSVKAEIIGSLKKGDVYTIIETSKSGNWGKLKHDLGWIGLKHTEVKKEVVQEDTVKVEPFVARVRVGSLNIRESATMDSKVVGKVKKGEAYTIVEVSKSGNWGKLKSGAGWVGLKFMNKLDGSAAHITPFKPYKATVNTTALRVRKGPGTGYKQVGLLSQGTKVEIIVEHRGWGQLKNKNWISLSYLRK